MFAQLTMNLCKVWKHDYYSFCYLYFISILGQLNQLSRNSSSLPSSQSTTETGSSNTADSNSCQQKKVGDNYPQQWIEKQTEKQTVSIKPCFVYAWNDVSKKHTLKCRYCDYKLKQFIQDTGNSQMRNHVQFGHGDFPKCPFIYNPRFEGLLQRLDNEQAL